MDNHVQTCQELWNDINLSSSWFLQKIRGEHHTHSSCNHFMHIYVFLKCFITETACVWCNNSANEPLQQYVFPPCCTYQHSIWKTSTDVSQQYATNSQKDLFICGLFICGLFFFSFCTNMHVHVNMHRCQISRGLVCVTASLGSLLIQNQSVYSQSLFHIILCIFPFTLSILPVSQHFTRN